MIGSQIGHYKILRQIGVGGMGEVYAAEDITLNREVALKLLPADMAADPERRERFDREAKVIAALDHPNIVTIYSVEQASGPDGDVHFITMQLIDGKTLSELIPAGGFSVDRYFELAIPLAEAVAVAHEQGITHRDLKPGNVMVADDGRLKVLDFGLAKLAAAGDTVATDGEMVTEAATGFAGAVGDLTEEGKVLGTVAYMSPEQAEGKAIDHRSDIFSLGIILYQMASGEAPFRGDTKLSIMSSIVKETPPSVTDLNSNVPRHLARIIKKCLEKDPARRYQLTLDLRNDLEELRSEYASGEVLPASAVGAGRVAPTKSPYALIGGAVVVTAFVVVIAMGWLGGATAPETDGDTVQWRTTRLTNLPGVETQPSLSSDGEFFVYAGDGAGNWDIYMQRVGGGRVFNLTEDSPDDDVQPAYSRDGNRIAFRSSRDGGGIYVMGATGENVRRLVDGGFFPTWSPDDTQIAYANHTFVVPWQLNNPREIWIVDVASGDTRMLTGEGIQPAWSPNGLRVAYFVIGEGGQRDVATMSVDGGQAIPVTNDEALDWSPQWSPDGGLLYFSSNRGGSNNMWRVPIDEQTGEVLGEPQAITTAGSDLQGYISLAGDGRMLAYAAQQRSINIQRVAFDPATGTLTEDPVAVTRGQRQIQSFDVSSDDSKIVFRSTFPQEDLILMDTDGTGESKITDDADRDRAPSFSPDGQRVYFYSDRGGGYQAWSIRTDGTDLTLHTPEPPEDSYFVFPVVSPDGQKLAISGAGDSFIIDLTVPYEQGLEALPWIDETHLLEVSDWSPDGRKLVGARMTVDNRRESIAVYTIESGEYQVLDGIAGNISTIWLSDNRRLLFAGAGVISLYDTETGETRELISLEVDAVFWPVLAPEDTAIYFLRVSNSGDIYLLTADDAGR